MEREHECTKKSVLNVNMWRLRDLKKECPYMAFSCLDTLVLSSHRIVCRMIKSQSSMCALSTLNNGLLNLIKPLPTLVTLMCLSGHHRAATGHRRKTHLSEVIEDTLKGTLKFWLSVFQTSFVFTYSLFLLSWYIYLCFFLLGSRLQTDVRTCGVCVYVYVCVRF